MDKQFDFLLLPPGAVYWRDEQEKEEKALKTRRGGIGQNRRREASKRIREPVGGGMKG